MTATADVRSEFALPKTPRYVDATSAFNLGAGLRPRSASTARDVETVERAVRETAAAGEHLVPMTTGHAASMITRAEQVRLLRTALDGAVEVDEERALVTFPAGTQWDAVVEAAARSGFAVPHGSSGTVGATGYLLGGGMSFYGRAWGVAANHVESFRIVTADGHVRHIDAENDPDLFWAVRGGGGGFGVVTSTTLRMTRLRQVLTGMTVWPAAHAGPILSAWSGWIANAPRTATTSLRLLNLPPLPDLPPVMTSGQIVALDGAIIPEGGDVEAAERVRSNLLDRLRAVAEPVLDTWHTGPVPDLLATHGDPQDPVGYVGDSFTIGHFDEAAAAAWVQLVGPASPDQVTSAELRQLGGAFREPSPTGGAYDHINADVLAFVLAVSPETSMLPAAERAVLAVRAGMSAWTSEWTAPTLVEHAASPRRTFPAAIEERVDAIRSRVDPDGVFALDVRRSISTR